MGGGDGDRKTGDKWFGKMIWTAGLIFPLVQAGSKQNLCTWTSTGEIENYVYSSAQ